MFTQLKGGLHRATPARGAKTRSYGTELTETTINVGKELELSLIGCFLPKHTVLSDAEVMTGTVVETNCDGTERHLQPLLKTFFKSSHNTEREMDLALTNLRVVTKADVEGIVESRLTKWTSTLQV